MRKAALFAVLVTLSVNAADWPDWRGPRRDGISAEKNLPVKWSPAGENLAWKAPYGGRSAPIVMGDRVYVLNAIGSGATLRERLMCLNADSGKVLWEHAYNVYLSDVPPHRVAWSSPTGDPETGNVYIFGVGGTLAAFNKDGKKLWERSLSEEVGLVTTHGGRTVSPVIEGDLVIVSGITTGWGNLSRAGHRFMAYDKLTGTQVWISSPGGRPFDTTYSPPVVADVEGSGRLLMAGGGDGTVHAIKVWTGEPVWKFNMSKRGVNTGVVLNGNLAIVTHSEENLETNEMGLIAALDARSKGDVTPKDLKWSKVGFQGGFSSPIASGDRLYQVDNGANLFAFDVNTGRTLWQQNLGTIQKASPVLTADGKMYVGSENGKFFILQPGQEKVTVLDEDQLPEGEQIIGSPAISNGRVFLVTSGNIYCIGAKKVVTPNPSFTVDKKAPAGAAVAHVQVVPAELALKPGEKASFKVFTYDNMGRLIGPATGVQWSLNGVKGALAGDSFTAPAEPDGQAGEVVAAVGGAKGIARVRVLTPMPVEENFEKLAAGAAPVTWINTTGKYSVREMDGGKVLVKHADNAATQRARSFFGPTDWSDYTVEADVRGVERRRQLGDAGVVAQRYNLVLFGNHQRLELQSWQPETARTVTAPFPWKGDVWYRVKLRVEPAANGKVIARGKAWPASEPEPEKWLLERTDEHPNLQGSPGIYANAPVEVFFDNVKVTPNSKK
jgi:outer membrane protein assembly factor BamB